MTIDPVSASGGAGVPATSAPDIAVPAPVVAPVNTGGAAAPATAASTRADSAAASAKPGASFQEHLQRMKGHSYARIEDGPRKGLYVNESGNSRNGEVFRLEYRDGRELHVYGAGSHALVVALPPREQG